MRTPALITAAGLLLIAAFQLALAVGAPFGEAAWGGGRSGRLPAGLRVASAAATVFWLIAALVILARGGVDVPLVPSAVARWGAWALVGVLSLGALMNFASSSRWERFLWGPLALALAVLSFIVARGAP
jgi:hypothetical protein